MSALDGDFLLVALAKLLSDEEVSILDQFGARWDDLAADEIVDWSLVGRRAIERHDRAGETWRCSGGSFLFPGPATTE